MNGTIASQRIAEFTDAVASDAPTPGGGAVAGTVAALAAALVGMAGRYSAAKDPDSALFRQLIERSDWLRSRAAALADADADAYQRYLEASRSKAEPEARRVAVREALDAAADVPFDLGALAAEVADAGEQLAAIGNSRLRSDACAAALLASAVAQSAAILVEANLHDRPDDYRLAQSVRHARIATEAADRAVAGYGFVRDRVTT